MSKFDALQDHEFRNDEWAARERENYALETDPSWLDRLIGTETCSYCDSLTECLSLPHNQDTEYFACRNCIAKAFDAAIGGS